jgi:hypothetical protein
MLYPSISAIIFNYFWSTFRVSLLKAAVHNLHITKDYIPNSYGQIILDIIGITISNFHDGIIHYTFLSFDLIKLAMI